MRLEDAVHLLGKQVRVTLMYDGRDPMTIQEGKLLAFGDDGTVKVQDEAGFVHYCWPMLDVVEVIA